MDRGISYTTMFYTGRRAMLDQAWQRAAARIDSDVRRNEAEREYLQKAIQSLDEQVEAYDKMLAKAAADAAEARKPLMSRTRTVRTSQSFTAAQSAAATKTNQDVFRTAEQDAVAAMTVPSQVNDQLKTWAQETQRYTDADAMVRRGQMARVINGMMPTLETLDKPGQRADLLTKMRAIAQSIATDEGEKALVDGLIKMAVDQDREAGEVRRLMTPEGREEELAALRQEYQLGVDVGAEAREATAGGPTTQTSGGFSTTETDAEVYAPGEAERMARYKTPEFQAAMAAVADGVISEDEQAIVAPFADDLFLQRMMDRGRIGAERERLAGRRSSRMEELAALGYPDTSPERERAIARGEYGATGITATEALLRPKQAAEKARPDPRVELAYNAALLAAEKPDLRPEDEARDRPYIEQTGQALLSGNWGNARNLLESYEKQVGGSSVNILAAGMQYTDKLQKIQQQQAAAKASERAQATQGGQAPQATVTMGEVEF